MTTLSEQDRFAALVLAAREITLGLSTGIIFKFADELLNEGYYHDDLLAIIDACPRIYANVLPPFQDFCEKHGLVFDSHEQATWCLVRYHVSRMTQEDSSPEEELGALINEFYSDWHVHLEAPEYEKYDLHELFYLTCYDQSWAAEAMRKAAQKWLTVHGGELG